LNSPSVRTRGVEAVVLAGSYQWTGSPFEELLSRPLLPVAQKPIIEYTLGWLKTAGVGHVVICGNGSTGALRQHFATGQPRTELPNLLFHEDGTPRGAAGCVRDASALTSAETLVVADGTSIPAFDLAELLAHHWQSGAALTVVAQERGGEPVSLHPTGVYVFERRVLDSVPATSFQDIKENLIPKLYRAGETIDVFKVSAVSPRVLNASTYLALNHWMISRLPSTAAHSSERAGRCSSDLHAHPTAWISPDAIVTGPVLVGPGVRVHAGATIIGPSSIGAGTVVESGAVVARSVTWNHCRIGEHAIVDQSVLADHAVATREAMVSNTVRLSPPRQPAARTSGRARTENIGAHEALARRGAF